MAKINLSGGFAMKKFLSVFLALVMCFAVAMPAFAADGENVADKGTLFDYRSHFLHSFKSRSIAFR